MADTMRVWAAEGRRVRGLPGPKGEAGALLGDGGIELDAETDVVEGKLALLPSDPYWRRKWLDRDITATAPKAKAMPAAPSPQPSPASGRGGDDDPAAGAGGKSKRGN